jgi:hypothetical protein
MWMQLRGVSTVRAVVDVAHQLGLLDDGNHGWLLREADESQDDPEEALLAAVAGCRLVLVERPRSAYWQGGEMTVDWSRHGALWDFLWELCRHAKRGQPVDSSTFGSVSGVVARQKCRLKALPGFPRDLLALMEPVGRGTQKLNLPPAHIRLFELASTETLREWTP